MSQPTNGRVIVISPSDVSLKISDIVEKIISGILEAGEVDVVGINDAAFLACSAANTATEIANVYVDELCIENLESPTLIKTPAISVHLTQKPTLDYGKMAEQEEKEMTDILEQTVSVSRAAPPERLLTLSLLRLSKFDKIRIVAAGGSINDAVMLALKLTRGQISKETIGIKLMHLYSIVMRNDPTKNIAALSIYLQKGMSTRYTKRQSALLKTRKRSIKNLMILKKVEGAKN